MKERLLEIVRKLMNPAHMSEEEEDRLEAEFEDSIPHPGGSDLLSYPELWGLGGDLLPEEIVEAALSWHPRILAMPIVQIRKHPFCRDLTGYVVELPNVLHTQIVSRAEYNLDDVCAVALSGVQLPSGRMIKHGFVHRMYSAGEILGLTSEPPGTEIPVNNFPDA